MFLENFNIFSLLIYFFIYSFLGWITEVLYAYWARGFFVNRGFLYGPLCPIYGSGIILVVLLLGRFSSNTIILFILATILTSLLEYITGFILENFFHTKWWDYSNNHYNLSGRICLCFSIIWGLASIAIIKIIHPLISYTVNLIPTNVINTFSLLLFIYFIIDLTFTIISLVQFNNVISQLTNIKEEIFSIVTNLKSSTLQIASNANYSLDDRIKHLKEKYDSIISSIKSNHIRLIRSFPHITSQKHNIILLDLKKKLRKITKNKR